jgi:hypothetical protein
MNTERYNNKELVIAVVIVATISVLFVAPSALTSPVFALGHWHEGDDNMESSSEEEEEEGGNTDISADNSESQVNQKGLVSCLANTQEGSMVTEDEIKDCLNTADGSEEDTEDNGSVNDNDAITVSDDDPENSNAPLNSISKGSSDIEDIEDIEDSTQSNENENENEE